MGSGCVPVCRNSGGPQVYMTHPLDAFLFPLEHPIDTLCLQVVNLLDDSTGLQNLSGAAKQIFREGLSMTQQRTNLLVPIFSDQSISSDLSFISNKE
jgi:hypothetical protein